MSSTPEHPQTPNTPAASGGDFDELLAASMASLQTDDKEAPTTPQPDVTTLLDVTSHSDVMTNRLPDEMPNEIGKHLYLHDQFFLSQTCRRLGSFFGRDWPATVRSLPPPHRENFDRATVHARWDIYLCRFCDQTHSMKDPSEQLPCGRGRYTFLGYGEDLSTHREDKNSPHSCASVVTPRIVDGRFLIRAQHTFPITGMKLVMLKQYKGYICSHSIYLGEYMRSHVSALGFSICSLNSKGDPCMCYMAKLDLPFEKGPQFMDLGFQKSVDLVLHSSRRGGGQMDIAGSCDHCCADYSISTKAEEGHLQVCVFYDLGGEDLAPDVNRHSPAGPKTGLPGSVQRLYMSGKGVGWEDFR